MDFTLTFQPGVTQSEVLVSTVDDTLSEGRESFTGSLRNPSAGLQIGMPAETTVFIEDNDGQLKCQGFSLSPSLPSLPPSLPSPSLPLPPSSP